MNHNIHKQQTMGVKLLHTFLRSISHSSKGIREITLDFLRNKKIAAIGIRVSKWIAYHGFAINIKNDLTKYNNIIPCGIADRDVTNLKEIKDINYSDLDNIIIKNFMLK